MISIIKLNAALMAFVVYMVTAAMLMKSTTVILVIV